MECAICFEESNLIIYKHDSICFDILVHDSCLIKWFFRNNFECPICRKSIFSKERFINSFYRYNQLYVADIENQLYIPRITPRNIIRRDNNIERQCNQRTCMVTLIAVLLCSVIITVIAASL
jgi:hypothetical protein